MNCERANERMIELIDGRLNDAEAREVRAHLESCPRCREELAKNEAMLHALDALPAPRPSPAVRAGVYAAIEAEKRALESPRPAPVRPSRSRPLRWAVQALAGCALLAIGYFAGARRPGATPATHAEVAQLKSRIESMGQLVADVIQQGQQQPAYGRLEAVLTTAAAPKPTASGIDSLISTLALDPSENVRLNAVEALYAHADQEVVRTAILVCLPKDSSPLVQVAMIDFLTAVRDPDAVPVLQRLVANPLTDPNVRDAAQRALARL